LCNEHTQFECNREYHHLLPISALLKHLKKPESSAPSSPLLTTSTAITHAVLSPAQTLSSVLLTLINTGSEQHVQVELPDVADLSDNNSDEGGMDNERADYESNFMKPRVLIYR
jgi:hypothetical protein